MHDTRCQFAILYEIFSSIKIILHQFNVDNNEVESLIGYDIIIGRDIMVHLVLRAGFKHEVLKLYGTSVSIHNPRSVLGKKINKSQDSQGGNTDCRTSFHKRSYWHNVKTIDINYDKTYIEHGATNATHMNDDERTEILGLLK